MQLHQCGIYFETSHIGSGCHTVTCHAWTEVTD